MGENKQVRVDNWGTYFLQRLQQFFNKTDFCDLTLQFEGNVQLKVHRLVMSACTDYFQILEQTCEMIDDIIIMPANLQADVILPIVNFMYTGVLDFHMQIYDRLYRTAELMNIPVLTKLLDAQRKPFIPINKTPKKSNNVANTWNSVSKKTLNKGDSDLPAPLPGRKLPVWKRRNVPVLQSTPTFESKFRSESLSNYDNAPKPTRFEWPEEDSLLFNLMDNSFDEISYTSKPLLTQDEEMRATTSSFDDIKHLPNVNKMTKEYTNSSMELEAMNDYIKEQKIRSDLVDEDDDEGENEINNLENIKLDAIKRKLNNPTVSSKRVKLSVLEKENKDIKSALNKTIEVDHTKIISEVLKKYPHLVKKNKNIKLKILAKNPKTNEALKVQTVKSSSSKLRLTTSPKTSPKSVFKSEVKKEDEGPWICQQCSDNGEGGAQFALYYLYLKHLSEVHNEKIDSRICKFCGHKSTKHNMLMYHQYTKHGVQPPPAYKFPKCNQCPYIALTEALLVKHKLNHLKFDFECAECKIAFNNLGSLQSHMQITAHSAKSGKTNFDCQYCTKKYQHGAGLFSHIKLQHREEARRDGVISIDEIENEDITDPETRENNQSNNGPPKDLNILSNFNIHSVQDENSAATASVQSEPDNINNVASGIATNLGLVDIVVLDDNQQYILHSNDQQLVQQQNIEGDSQFILPTIGETHNFSSSQNITEHHNVITQSMLSNSDIASTDELVMVLTDHDYNDGNSDILNNENSNIVVLYSHPVDGQDNQFITSQGNLLINSQTGILEIRNTVPTSSSNDLVVTSQESHIESIEMIQREINNHNETKLDDKPKSTNMGSEEQLSSSENTENQSNPIKTESHIPVYSETTDVTKSQDVFTSTGIKHSENNSQSIETQLETESGICDNSEQQTNSLEMETPQQTTNMENTVIADENQLVDEKVQTSVTSPTHIKTSFENVSYNSRPCNEISISIKQSNSTESQSLEVPPPDNYNEFVEEEPMECDDSQENMSGNNEKSNNEVNVAESVIGNPNENKFGDLSFDPKNNILNSETIVKIDVSLETNVSQSSKDNNNSEKSTDLSEHTNAIHPNSIENIQTNILESSHLTSENINVFEQCEVITSEAGHSLEKIKKYNGNSDVCDMNLEKENTQKDIFDSNNQLVEESKIQFKDDKENTNKRTEDEDVSSDTQQVSDQPTSPHNLEETHLKENTILGKSVSDINSTDKGGNIECDMTVHIKEEETQVNLQNIEELKAESEPLCVKEVSRRNSESTKTAILDDWEDTDSQSSDHGETKKVNVNKIIDDWEDEDDEENKK